MADKQPTPGMPQRGPDDPHKGEQTGIVPEDERGAGGGGPTGPKDAGKGWHGGQTNPTYHGPGQLGEDDVDGRPNPNAPNRGS